MKNTAPLTSLIILTRNEISGLKTVLSRIPFHAVSEVLAIDYQSTDGTVEFFRSHNIKVIQQHKSGRGYAFQLAAKRAKGTYLIFFSPDGNEDPSDIPKLIEQLKNGYDLSIASRFMRGSRNEEDDQCFKFRAWANQCFTLIVKMLWGGNISDTINGYRAIRKDVFNALHLDADGFAIEFQMSIRALKKGYKIQEIPTREGNRIGGASTAYAISTGITFVGFLLREIWIGKKF